MHEIVNQLARAARAAEAPDRVPPSGFKDQRVRVLSTAQKGTVVGRRGARLDVDVDGQGVSNFTFDELAAL